MSGDVAEIMGHKVDLSKVNNRALRRVIRECKNEFLFLYGDHDQYKENHKDYSDHREKYKEWKEHGDHKEHSDNHTDHYCCEHGSYSDDHTDNKFHADNYFNTKR